MFCAFVNLHILVKCPFYESDIFAQIHVLPLHCNKALLCIGGRLCYVWWFSPHLDVNVFLSVLFLSLKCRGENIGRRCNFILSFSPLFFICFLFCCCFLQMSGRLHRVVNIIYSRSPLSEPVYFYVYLRWDYSRGDYTGEDFVYSRSPLMNRNLVLTT